MVIPDDIAFVGFSESQKALIIEPNLTSVEQPTFEMGKVTAELLLEQIKNNSDETKPSKTIILDAKLNIRESSIKNNYSTVANVNILICIPSTFTRQEAHASVVEPVVNTSSTISICFPASTSGR